LGRIGESESLDYLIPLIQDIHPRVRTAVAEALGNLGDTSAVAALTGMLHDSYFTVRQEAVRALGKIGDVKAIASLTPFLDDDSCETRVIAATALGNIGDVSAVAPLIQALDEPQYGPKKYRYWELQREITEVLGTIGSEEAVDRLIRALAGGNCQTNDCDVQVGAAKGLGAICDPRSVVPLAQALGNKYWELRKVSAEALAEMGDTRAVESLSKTLKDEDWEVRRAAALSLGRIGDTRILNNLIKALKDEKTLSTVAQSLRRIGDIRAIIPVIQVLPIDNPSIRTSFIKAIKESTPYRTLEIVTTALEEAAIGDKARKAIAKMKMKKLKERL
jgi:HEAT repeat protein